MKLSEHLRSIAMQPTLHDAPTGKIIPDSADDYEIVRFEGDSAVVRGPSGQLDVATFHDGCRLERDAAIE